MGAERGRGDPRAALLRFLAVKEGNVSVLDRVPVERVQAQSEVDVRRMLLTALVGSLYAVGWLLGKAVRITLTALAAVLYGAGRAAGWAFAAVRVGWSDATAQSGRRGPA